MPNHFQQKSFILLLSACAVVALNGCSKSTPPPSEESADPPMISMESAVPEEQPAGSFKMSVSSAQPIVAEKPAQLSIDLAQTDGSPAPKLKMKETNLLIVCKDGKDFQRIKPVESAPGKLQLTVSFPHDGEYESCLQFTTNDGKNFSTTTPIQIGKGKTGVTKLKPDLGEPKEVDGYSFNLVDAPEHPSDKLVSMPSFRISKDKRPVSDIQPIDGQAGFAVVIKEGEEKFLRVIPVTNQSANKFFQQPVMFHVKIAEPGIYRMWTQFKINDAIHTVDYTFQLTPESAS